MEINAIYQKLHAPNQPRYPSIAKTGASCRNRRGDDAARMHKDLESAKEE